MYYRHCNGLSDNRKYGALNACVQGCAGAPWRRRRITVVNDSKARLYLYNLSSPSPPNLRGALCVRSRKSRFCHLIVSRHCHVPICVPFSFFSAVQSTGWLAISDGQSALRQVRRVVRRLLRGETSAANIGPASARCARSEVARRMFVTRLKVIQSARNCRVRTRVSGVTGQ